MASGDTLEAFKPADNEPPASAYAQADEANGAASPDPVLAFDDTTAEYAVFTGLMPRNYAGGGITLSLLAAMASATSGTLGWTVELERRQAGTTSIGSDSWATAQTITAVTVPGTAGVLQTFSLAISSGANMASIAAGEWFRLRLKRDVANDTATGDAWLKGLEIRET